MTNKEIEKELKKIYQKRRSWNGAKGPFTEEVIKQRELILMKQQILYNIEDAKKKEIFNFEIYKIIDNYLKNDF